MTGWLDAPLRALALILLGLRIGVAVLGLSAATLVIAGALPAFAQEKSGEAAKAPASLSTKDLQALIKTLEDKGKRDEFLGTLKALLKARQTAEGAAKKEGGAGLLAKLSEQAKSAANEIVGAASALLKAGTFWRWLGEQWADPLKREKWKLGILIALAVLAIGLVGEWIARLLLRRPRATVEAKGTDAWTIKLLFLAARTFLDLLPIVAFAGAAYGALPLFDPPDAVRLIALTIIYASVLSRSIKAVARMILVPKAETLRLIPMETENARYLMLWVRRFTTLAVYGYFIAEAALLFGLPAGGHAVLIKVLGLALAIMAVIFILQNRKVVAAWLRGQAEAEGVSKGFAGIQARFADVWHILAVLYVVGAFIVWALDIEGGFEYLLGATAWTAIILFFAYLAVRVLDAGVRRLFRVGDDLANGVPELEERANRYLPVIFKAVRVVVAVMAGLAILQAWGVDTVAWMTGPVGEQIIGSLITIAAVLIGALIVWELISGAIERYLEDLKTSSRDKDRVKRLSTLLPLARNAILVALVIFVALIVLSELGINIGPLLAGAGVLGLAIGFGAQTLVKDIITGLFILVEDTVKVGDVVEVSGTSGTVEGVTIRTLTLRDLWGNVHVIPFSNITAVKNSSPDYAYYLFDIGVGYNEDVDHVMAVLREIDEEIRADTDYKSGILEPLDIWGVNAFADSAVVIRARLKTTADARWPTGREYNRRIKLKFDEVGIEIPYPHQTIYFGELKDGTAPPLQARHEAGLPKPKPVAKAKTAAEKPKKKPKKKQDTRAQFSGDGE